MEPENLLPSGTQIELRQGDRSAVVTSVGATLRSFQTAGVDLVDGFPASSMASGGRGQVLCPWPNRVAGGRYAFADATLQLPLTEVARGNANHGLCRFSPFSVIDRRAEAVRLGLRLYPQPGYPFFVDVEVEYRLEDGGLVVTLTARNPGARAAPVGLGHHPYFRPPGLAVVDDAVLRLPAATFLPTDDHAIPNARTAVAGSPFDFRAGRPIGALAIDTGFTDLIRDDEGWARIALTGADATVTVAVDAAFGHLQVYSGDTLPTTERRSALAIEPMTCAANAFNSGDGLVVLAPGDALRATYRVSVQ